MALCKTTILSLPLRYPVCMSFCYLTGVTCEHGSSAHSCLKLIFEQVWKPCEDLAVDQGVLNRLGCALQPIACGVSDGLVYFAFCCILVCVGL